MNPLRRRNFLATGTIQPAGGPVTVDDVEPSPLAYSITDPAAAQRAGEADAERHVGEPGAESLTTRQEPAFPDALGGVARREAGRLGGEANQRIHALAGVAAGIPGQMADAHADRARLESSIAVVSPGRTNLFGEFHLFFIALVAALGSLLEITMIDLSLRWLNLDPPSEYRIVAVVVSASMASAAVMTAVAHRAYPPGTEVPPRVRVAVGTTVAILIIALEAMHGIPGVARSGGIWETVAAVAIATIAGAAVASIKRYPSFTTIAGIALLAIGLVSLAKLRGSPALMSRPTSLEKTWGTAALGAAAFAANFAIYLLTDAILERRRAHSSGRCRDDLDRKIEESQDLLNLASVVQKSLPRTIEEARAHAHTSINDARAALTCSLWAYSRGHQLYLAEAAPDLREQIRRVEADMDLFVAREIDQIDRIAAAALLEVERLSERG